MTAIKAAITAINAGITGIVRAYDDPPSKINTADMPLVYMQLGPFDMRYNAADSSRMDYHWQLIIVGDPVSQNIDQAYRIAKLEPFVERFRDAYAAAITLSGTADHSMLIGGELGILFDHAVLIFNLDVTSKEAVTVAG